jgi:prevent-host-death family protein
MWAMIETTATATDFRKHLAIVANAVGYRQDRCVITRHGKEFVALVSYEDLVFLRKHRPRKIGPPSVDAFSPKAGWHDHFPDPPLPQTVPGTPEEEAALDEPIDPWTMPLDKLREACEVLEATDDTDLQIWAMGVGRFALRERENALANPRSPSSPHNSG